MSKRFLPEITYMRGLCMLGVIAIHVGSYALINPYANPTLIAFLEILSRFSIPTFFFLSAFGLFLHNSVDTPFSYLDFMKRRLSIVLVPYLTWSVLYTAYTCATIHSWAPFSPWPFTLSLLFGTASYQLYFLVIILWFYALMPVWRFLVRKILLRPLPIMAILLLVQIAINYYISFYIGALHFASPALQYLLDMRLNYWIILYFWVFLFGALVAERYDRFVVTLHQYSGYVIIAFILSVISMLAFFIQKLYILHYTLLEAIYTVHQLHPAGVIYTATSILFFLYVFRVTPLSTGAQSVWNALGQNSYGMYLIHPFILYWVTPLLEKLGYYYSAPSIIGLYIITIILSFYATEGMSKLPKHIKTLLLGR